MPCTPLFDADGHPRGFMCGPRQPVKPCFYCGKPHEILCDWPLPNGKTCDRRTCRAHATRQPGTVLDYCQEHQAVHAQAQEMEF